MISLDYITLHSFLLENKDFLLKAKLQKIQQPTRKELILTCRNHSETRKLYINIDSLVYHLCFITEETYRLRHIQIPQKPPMFCMLLRKHLEGATITNVNIPDYERIFEIFFNSYNELNEEIQLCLSIELMGKHSNIILYDTQTNNIIGCAHNVGPEKSQIREISGKLLYTYPPKQNKKDILKHYGNINYNTLNEDFLGISKAYQELFYKNKTSLEDIKNYVQINNKLTPSITQNNFCIYSELLQNSIRTNSVNEMIDIYFSNEQNKILFKALKLKLKNIVTPKLKKYVNTLEKVNSQIYKKNNAEKYKLYADLIMTNIYNNKDYSNNIIVTDWNNNSEITIPLDKTLTLKENHTKYYKLYTKSKNDIDKLYNLKIEIEENIKHIEQILYTINSADTTTQLYEILEECSNHNDNNSAKKKVIKTEPEITNINGFQIYIGRNNNQNDYIVSKLSNSEDIWFHVHNCPGSHILLKIIDNKIPDNDTILKCAQLAKEYSTAKNDTKVGVIYTKRKYLKKPPKANLGYVTYKNEKEIII